MERILWSIFAGVFGFLAWHGIALALSDSVLFVGPVAIVRYVAENAGLLGRATFATMSAAAWGFFWGNLAAITLVALAIVFPIATRLINALALLVFCLPLVATGPILRVLYGPGDGPQITLAALAVYYTSFLALMVGSRAIPSSWSDLVKTYGRGRFIELWVIRAAASLPYFRAALQIAAPAALLGAMIGEFTGAERGLGVLTLRAMRSLDVAATWTLACIAAILAIAAYAAIGAMFKRMSLHTPALLLSAPHDPVRRPMHTRLLQSVGLIGVVLLVWQCTMDGLDLNAFFAKRPGDIWTFLISGSNAQAARTTLGTALFETLSLTIPGYLAGLALGLSLASLFVLSPMAERLALPVAIALRSVPIITTAPLVVLGLGRDALGTVTIVAVMIFFPTLVACLQGLRQVPGQVTDVFQSYAAGPVKLLVFAQMPAMLPAFFAAARMAVPAAVLAVTTTEWLATGKGIGVLMALTATTSDYNMLWSCVVVVSLMTIAGYVVVGWIAQRTLNTYAPEQTV